MYIQWQIMEPNENVQRNTDILRGRLWKATEDIIQKSGFSLLENLVANPECVT